MLDEVKERKVLIQGEGAGCVVFWGRSGGKWAEMKVWRRRVKEVWT